MTHEVEAKLDADLERCIENACPMPMPKLLATIVEIVRRIGTDTTTLVVGDKWMRGFSARNTGLTRRLPSNANQGRPTRRGQE